MLAEGWEKAGIPPVTEEMDKRRSGLERGWYWGSQQFAERMLKIGEGVLKKDGHGGEESAMEYRAHGEEEARRLIAEGLKAAGVDAADLETRPGSDFIKVALAEIVWSRTTVNMEWIAKALTMRSASNARQQIRRMKEGELSTKAKQSRDLWTNEFKEWLEQSQISA